MFCLDSFCHALYHLLWYVWYSTVRTLRCVSCCMCITVRNQILPVFSSVLSFLQRIHPLSQPLTLIPSCLPSPHSLTLSLSLCLTLSLSLSHSHIGSWDRYSRSHGRQQRSAPEHKCYQTIFLIIITGEGPSFSFSLILSYVILFFLYLVLFFSTYLLISLSTSITCICPPTSLNYSSPYSDLSYG